MDGLGRACRLLENALGFEFRHIRQTRKQIVDCGRSSCRVWRRSRPKKLWQGCGENPDFTAKTDITETFRLSRISNLRVCNAPRLHPAYRLICHKVFERKVFMFLARAIVARFFAEVTPLINR